MLFFLLYTIRSTIFDYTIPRLFETIDDYKNYNPNVYNYDIIHKEFNVDQCLNTNQYRSTECLKYSMKKYFNPYSLIKANNPQNYSFFQIFSKDFKKQKIIDETLFKEFWFKCGKKQGNTKCIELFDVYHFFNDNDTTNNYLHETKEQKGNSIFSQLREAHYLMYNIGQQNETKIESENDRQKRFQKAYEILKPIAFLAFNKYITDHFGSFRPLNRFNRSLVSEMLGVNAAYNHELKILLEHNQSQIEKDPSWMFPDIIYPSVAKLLKDIVSRRKRGPDYPLNLIYSNLLQARFPYLFEEGFRSKESYEKVRNHLHHGYKIETLSSKVKKVTEFGDFYVGDDLYQDDAADNIHKYDEMELEDSDEYYDIDDDYDNDEDEEVNDNNDDDNKTILSKESSENFDSKNGQKNDLNEEIKIDNNDNKKSDDNQNEDKNETSFDYKKDENETNDQNYSSESEDYEEPFYEYDDYNLYDDDDDDNDDNDDEDEEKYYYFCENNQENETYQLYYNYNVNETKTEKEIFYQKKTKYSFKSLLHKLFYHNGVDDDDSYSYVSYLILSKTFQICKNYLESVKNIEGLNQSNLTTKIATIYGINQLFKEIEKQQFLKRARLLDLYDENDKFIQCKFIDEGLYYLMIAAKNKEVKAVEALLFKFLLLTNETNNTKIIDNYFDLVIDELSDFYDKNENKSYPSNIYVHYHDLFSSFVSDFFDSIIFFDNKLRNYFQVDQISSYNETYHFYEIFSETNKKNSKSDYIYNNPRNWTYEDAAKALRRFIDSSFIYQSGHLAEYSLSNASSSSFFKKYIYFWSLCNLYFKKITCFIANIFGNLISSVFNIKYKEQNYSEENNLNYNEILVNGKIFDKRSFYYALRVYQTLALSGNRDAMWNAQILMKQAKIQNQLFTMFITESNESFFLHELVNETEIFDDLKENEKNNTIVDKRSIKGYFYLAFSYISDLFNNKIFNKNNNKIDFIYYEKIADKDPYAAFSLAWEKKDNLTAALELLEKTEKMKPESKIAVFISKMIITIYSFFNSLFSKNTIIFDEYSSYTNSSYSVVNSTSNKTSNYSKFEHICEFINNFSFLKEVLLGSEILIVLTFFIYIRISLYA